jgi:hypothetical protein
LENKLKLERIWVQRSIALVLLFMFWNGFTDIFWMAPSLLFNPLQLILWLLFVWNYRAELKSMSFVWILGLGVLLNTIFLSFRFSNLIARTIDLQLATFQISVLGITISSILFVSTAWYLVFRNLLQGNPNKRLFLILYVLLCVPSILLVGADGLIFSGVLMSIFILKSNERQPFHWFIIGQVVSIFFSFAQFVYQLSIGVQ